MQYFSYIEVLIYIGIVLIIVFKPLLNEQISTKLFLSLQFSSIILLFLGIGSIFTDSYEVII